MRKIFIVILALLLVMGVTVGLFACNKSAKTSTDTPSGNIENPSLQKVHKAFNGVESSMIAVSSLSGENTTRSVDLSATVRKERAPLALAAGDGGTVAMTESAALDLIRNTYVSGDRQADASAEIDYDQPPMQQFRYLKAIFDQMGDDYELGTKYYFDVTGRMYFDIETGYMVKSTAANAADYLYDYVFSFALSVELRENDLIFAEVSFNINLTKGAQKYETLWYVSFDLRYDFNESTPTYTLLMYTDNREGDLPYLDRAQGYEYDYVDMQSGAINEWRKFEMDTDRKVVYDASKTTFEDYISQGITYRVGTCKWLKDGAFYKVTQMTDAKNRSLAIALADGLGLNTTHINSEVFLAKTGKENALINTFYQRISETYGGDIIYDLVCKDEDDQGNGSGGQSSATWENVVAAAGIPAIIPAFGSASVNFTVAYDGAEETWTIGLSNVGTDDYSAYAQALQRAGFRSQGNDSYLYLDEANHRAILVAISIERSMIAIKVSAVTGTAEVKIPSGISYQGDYIGENTTQIIALKDIADVLPTISSGIVTAEKLSGFISDQSFVVDITLKYDASAGLTASAFALDAANKYAGYYAADNRWTARYNNTVNYKSLDSCDVIVLVTSREVDYEAHLVIYVIAVGEGTAESIVDGTSTDGNGETDDEGGNGGEIGGGGSVVGRYGVRICYLDQYKKVLRSEESTFSEGELLYPNSYLKNKEKMYLDKECTQEVSAPIPVSSSIELYVWERRDAGGEVGGGEIGGHGNEEDPENKDGDPATPVEVYVAVLDRNQNILSEGYQTFNDGQTVSVSHFITEEGQKVYCDRYCTDLVEDTVVANAFLQLYVWKELPKGTFTVYDVTEEGTTQYASFDAYIGSGDYFGYSFERILYWDEGCTDAIALDYVFNLTEEGITVYRHIYDDVFVLNVVTYINGHYYATDSSIHRKEKIYPAFRPFGAGLLGDYYPTTFYGDGEYYLGEGRRTPPLNGASMLATSADTLTVSLYITSDVHHVYTLKTESGTVLTEDYISTFSEFDDFTYGEGMGNIFNYHQWSADYCTRSGNVITLHGVKTLLGPLNVYYVWNGRQLCVNTAYDHQYFNSDSYPMFVGSLGASDTFFRDLACSDPIVYVEKEGDDEGVYEVKGALTLYTPIELEYVY